MEPQNLSLEVDFVRNLSTRSKNTFGELANIEHLSFEPETTGVVMQVESLITRNVASKRDMTVLKTAQTSSESEEVSYKEPGAEAEIDRIPIDTEPSEGEATALRDMTLLPEVIVGPTSDILPIWFLETGVNRSRTVCKLETSGIDYKGRQGTWRGTGFLISENILLTNHHVLNTRNVCDNAVCIFNYQTNESGKMQPTQTFQLNPGRLFLTSAVNDLDFTLCWVDGMPGKEFGYFPISRHAFTVKKDDCANIIQHPNGEPKSVVVQQNQVTNQDEIVVHYTSDTRPGSSGGCVCNNEWKLFALHHASRELTPADLISVPPQPTQYINEGIKLSAIATYLETLSGSDDRSAAAEVLALFGGTDAMLGYFGGLGRTETTSEPMPSLGVESVVDLYKGEAKDVDIGFWNIEWFNKNYLTKLDDVAQIIVRMNLDVWAFEESSPQAAKALTDYLRTRYLLDYGYAASEPNASTAKQTTTVIWNKKTVNVERKDWPAQIDAWFSLNSTGISDADDLVLESDGNLLLESVDGKIFDRYPGLFFLKTLNRPEEDEFTCFIVPLHLKAKGEGSKRRQLASRILAVAVQTMIDKYDADADWVLGGDLNATLASEDLNFLTDGRLTAISAEDETDRAFSYVKAPFRSMIDHVFLSPNLSRIAGSDDFFIVAQDKVIPDYLSISDHRPVLVRLSLRDAADRPDGEGIVAGGAVDDDLTNGLNRLRDRPQPTARPIPDTSTASDALSALRQNQSRVYYDAEADKRARDTYYGLLPTGQNARQLFDHFSSLVTRTHKTTLPYKPATYLYPWVDLQPDKRSLRNIYSGELTTPEALIEADFQAEARRSKQLYETRSGFEAASTLEIDLLLEGLEAEFPFNCEHVVPQSWFNKANPMKGDLHHLFACTPRCNSFRSNTPYFEFLNWEERTMEECGLSETQGFEPKDGKGTVARATLYFLLRYPKKITQYTREQLTMLITWHVNEPVKDYERHRNAAIQELQGNRNPLIDFGQLATQIDFLQGLR